MIRIDGRKVNQLRKIKIKKNYLKYSDGSCFIEWGNTKVLCTATLEDRVPHFLRNKGRGWLTAEYGMIPMSCNNRIQRESSRGKVSGRTQEIQRFIGRSLRAVIDFYKMGEKTIIIDCDVIQGDGGTRTASITGSFIALSHLVDKHIKSGSLKENVIKDYIAAVSVGVIKRRILLDLCYEEDSKADVDMNVVMTGSNTFVEIQGTAEGNAFTLQEFNKLIDVSRNGISKIISLQKRYITL